MSKFLRLALIAIWFGASCCCALGAAPDRTIRFAMTPAFLHDQHTLLAQWHDYLEVRLNRPVEFVQRDRYRDTMDLLQQQKVDFAWICDYPYVMLKKELRLVAVALNEGKPTYRSYLIVPARDLKTQNVNDLKGGVFAYAAPHSNTGYLVPRFEIKQSGLDPEKFSSEHFLPGHTARRLTPLPKGWPRGQRLTAMSGMR